jgi:hypothetical protein
MPALRAGIPFQAEGGLFPVALILVIGALAGLLLRRAGLLTGLLVLALLLLTLLLLALLLFTLLLRRVPVVLVHDEMSSVRRANRCGRRCRKNDPATGWVAGHLRRKRCVVSACER